MGHGGWGTQGGDGYPISPPKEMGLGALGLSDAAVYAFIAVLKGVAMM